MSEYKAGDPVYVDLGGGVLVGLVCSQPEADSLNAGATPTAWGAGLTFRATGRIHYYSSCGGRERSGLAWSPRDTTCRRCLMTRARRLRGWRWNHEANREDVAHLRSILGARVDGFGEVTT